MKKQQIVRKIINLVPSSLRNYTLFLASQSDPFSFVQKDDKKIVVMLGADYGNLGDVAITESQKEYLKAVFPDHVIIEVPISRTYRDMKSLKRRLNAKDIVTLVGGGNTGSLYPEIEAQRRFIVGCFPENQIVAFPQSVHFSQDSKSQKILSLSAKSYSRHANLIMLARDQYSYDFFTQKLGVKSGLFPDIVLSTQSLKQVKRSKTAVISIRSDKESSLPVGARIKITNELKNSRFKVVSRDTDIKSTKLTPAHRKEELKQVLDLYLGAQLVVTDRLHGMIFCVITKTPCIVFDNNNGKVLGAFKLWIKDTDYVRILNPSDIDAISSHVDKLLEKSKGSRKSLKNKFDELEKILKGIR